MAYTYFYNSTMKNISIALLNIMKDLTVVNYDTSGAPIKTIPVVCQFSVPEKDWYMRKINNWWDFENVEQNQRYYVSKPRINLSFLSMSYDQRRQSDSNGLSEFISKSMELSGTNVASVLTNINPTPWLFEYQMEIRTESFLHLTEILEQFLVYFNPSVQLRVKEFANINIERDLKVSITSISFAISEEKDQYGFKTADCSIGLSVEGNLYRPLSTTGIVKQISTNYFTSENVAATSGSF